MQEDIWVTMLIFKNLFLKFLSSEHKRKID